MRSLAILFTVVPFSSHLIAKLLKTGGALPIFHPKNKYLLNKFGKKIGRYNCQLTVTPWLTFEGPQNLNERQNVNKKWKLQKIFYNFANISLKQLPKLPKIYCDVISDPFPIDWTDYIQENSIVVSYPSYIRVGRY